MLFRALGVDLVAIAGLIFGITGVMDGFITDIGLGRGGTTGGPFPGIGMKSSSSSCKIQKIAKSQIMALFKSTTGTARLNYTILTAFSHSGTCVSSSGIITSLPADLGLSPERGLPKDSAELGRSCQEDFKRKNIS